jgi:hypothetical protein
MRKNKKVSKPPGLPTGRFIIAQGRELASADTRPLGRTQLAARIAPHLLLPAVRRPVPDFLRPTPNDEARIAFQFRRANPHKQEVAKP